MINANDIDYIIWIYSMKNDSLKKNALFQMIETRFVEENGGSEFNKFSIILLVVDDKKFYVTPVPSQY
ncbi:hypothetical protein H5410_005447 [Solanum commersonii]|uniref:Uncharacterized protein n=1 Tax=Solanum commersonii TaxID=4109 RepID=A0A9J6A6M8_SOLCO|nr:hypothetical protein H5410_005447 [Solanum commersonii]